VLLWYLKEEPSQEVRQQILLTSLTQTSGINLPVRFVVFATPSPDGATGSDALLEEAFLPALQSKCVEMLNSAAQDGRLAAQENLPALLVAWREWGNESDVRVWVEEQASTDEGFISVVRRFVQPVRATTLGSHVSTTKWRITLGTIEPYLTVGALRARLTTIDDAGLDDGDKRAVEALRTAIERRDNGLADSDFS
jgi:predicted KAP-like P-loop ATPase